MCICLHELNHTKYREPGARGDADNRRLGAAGTPGPGEARGA